jgi:hypothetical protein
MLPAPQIAFPRSPETTVPWQRDRFDEATP